NSGRADFGNRISVCGVSGIPSHGTPAPVSRQSAKTTPCTVAGTSEINGLRAAPGQLLIFRILFDASGKTGA
ncbi:hypothetical protein K7462_29255, partial [Pseudomonas fluorescens]|nr:hypothetical protein [Pseudomonas fluorescens]